MINLIIDAAKEKIVFVIIDGEQSYTTTHINSRENFDNFMKLLLNFFNKKKVNMIEIHSIFINLGPGKFTSLRISLSVAKALSLVTNAGLFGFKSKDLIKKKYKNLIKMDKKNFIINNLIKPIYSS